VAKHEKLTIKRPDDFHLHLRDGVVLKDTVAVSARDFTKVIVMPNTVPPIINAHQARKYKERICAEIPESSTFKPLMTLYLTDNTTTAMVAESKDMGDVFALKYYPAGVTTNSDQGVTDIKNTYSAIEAMIDAGLPLLIHGEVNDPDVDIFDREKVFIDRYLVQLVQRYPELKVVFEHITTKEAAEFVVESSDNVAATITPQHLLFNRNDLLVGGIKPHLYCLPILKCCIDQKMLLRVATSGNKKFFLGTDSAPHLKGDKESACGCAGCFSAPYAMGLYAEMFDLVDSLDKLENFASVFGSNFYGLPRNTSTITLTKKNNQVRKTMAFGNGKIIPLMAGQTLKWQVAHEKI